MPSRSSKRKTSKQENEFVSNIRMMHRVNLLYHSQTSSLTHILVELPLEIGAYFYLCVANDAFSRVEYGVRRVDKLAYIPLSVIHSYCQKYFPINNIWKPEVQKQVLAFRNFVITQLLYNQMRDHLVYQPKRLIITSDNAEEFSRWQRKSAEFWNGFELLVHRNSVSNLAGHAARTSMISSAELIASLWLIVNYMRIRNCRTRVGCACIVNLEELKNLRPDLDGKLRYWEALMSHVERQSVAGRHLHNCAHCYKKESHLGEFKVCWLCKKQKLFCRAFLCSEECHKELWNKAHRRFHLLVELADFR